MERGAKAQTTASISVMLLCSTKEHRVHGAPQLNHVEGQCAHTISSGKINLTEQLSQEQNS